MRDSFLCEDPAASALRAEGKNRGSARTWNVEGEGQVSLERRGVEGNEVRALAIGISGADVPQEAGTLEELPAERVEEASARRRA